MQVVEFVKSCFDGEAIVIKEVVAGRLARRKMYGGLFKPVMRRRDGVFCSGLVSATLRRVGANGHVLDSFREFG